MKVRKHKLRVIALMAYISVNAGWQRKINEWLKPTPEEIAASNALLHKMWADMRADMQAMAPPPPVTVELVWKVARAKDDVVVLEAKSAEEAEEAIAKAARQKKAKLYLKDAPYQHATA